MAEKHPYISGSGSIVQTITQLRSAFPAVVNADTLRKLSIAPNNETYVLNILKFLKILDAEGKKLPAASSVMNKHDDKEFQDAFAELVSAAYHQLFDLHQDKAWGLSKDKLISFFRHNDDTGSVLGDRQAGTFQTLARIAGKVPDGAAAAAKTKAPNGTSRPAKAATKKVKVDVSAPAPAAASVSVPLPGEGRAASGSAMALTVRIEINLPAGGDQQTYDYIFKSIRENLLNGNT